MTSVLDGAVATFPLALRRMCDSPRTGCARRTTPIYKWREQAVIEWSWHVLVATVWSFAHLPLGLSDHNRALQRCFSLCKHSCTEDTSGEGGNLIKEYRLCDIYFWLPECFIAKAIKIWLDDGAIPILCVKFTEVSMLFLVEHFTLNHTSQMITLTFLK